MSVCLDLLRLWRAWWCRWRGHEPVTLLLTSGVAEITCTVCDCWLAEVRDV